METFRLYDEQGTETKISPIEFFRSDKVSRYSGLTEAEQDVYDELWALAEGGEPLSEDLGFGNMRIKADKVTWKLT